MYTLLTHRYFVYLINSDLTYKTIIFYCSYRPKIIDYYSSKIKNNNNKSHSYNPKWNASVL